MQDTGRVDTQKSPIWRIKTQLGLCPLSLESGHKEDQSKLTKNTPIWGRDKYIIHGLESRPI